MSSLHSSSLTSDPPSKQLDVSLPELREFAAEVATSLHGGEILALRGDLGAGKTTFVQFLAEELGITSAVNSPTFGLYKQYQTKKGFDLHHFDWYRLSGEAEVEQLGVADLFGQPDAVTVIEWPDRADTLLPRDTISIGFEYVNAETRRITFNTGSVS